MEPSNTVIYSFGMVMIMYKRAKYNMALTHSHPPGPVGEVVEAEKGDAVGVDGEGDGEDADDVHHHAGLHHVHGLEGAVTEDDGVGGGGHR